MASHGGIIGLIVGVTFWSWRKQRNALALYDAVSATAPLGVLLGRLANFINGELWGRPSEVPWAVIFPEATRLVDADSDSAPSQPALRRRTRGTLDPFGRPLHPQAHATTRAHDRRIAMMIYAAVRFFDEFFRQPDEGYELFSGMDEQRAALLDPLC